MNIYENYTEQDIDEFALGIGKVAHHFARQTAAAGTGERAARS